MSQPGLADALALHLGGNVSVVEELVGDPSGLLGVEVEVVEKAIDKRRFEFAAGRRAARRALQSLDAPALAIPTGPNRAPLWPEGIIGSITHDAGLALAIVGRTDHVSAVGVDLTEAAPLPGQTRSTILREEEAGLSDLDARAAFAVKECLFKALHPQVNAFFGFDAARVHPELARNAFTVTLCRDLGPFKAETAFQGTLLHQDQRIAAALVLS